MSDKQVSSFRDLKVWHLGMQISEDVYRLTLEFPREELYGLTSQIRRAVVSVPANIAEGHAKAFTKDYIRHLAIALGSLAEVETFCELAVRLEYLGSNKTQQIFELIGEERRMLRGLQRSLRTKL